MTFGEGKRKTLMLMDEYSSGGQRTQDRDIELKMADFFDLAQRNVSQFQPIRAKTALTLEDPVEKEGPYGVYDLPGDVGRLTRAWKNGRVATGRYRVRGKQLLVPLEETGSLQIEYHAVPATITPETPDEYVFQVTEEGAACMPYFVAAQQLAVDLVTDHTALLGLYDRMLAKLDPGGGDRFGGLMRQSFFR